MRIIGHRGAAAVEPENTLRAFAAALDAAADGIETDVRLSADGRLVLSHDDDVWRRSGATGSVSAMRWEALRALDVGQGERMPLLEDVLHLTTRWYLELKPHGPGDALAGAVAPLLHGVDAVVSSFDHACVDAVRAHEPRARTALTAWRGAALEHVLRRSVAGGHAEVHCSQETFDEAFVARAHGEGIDVLVWTVNDTMRARDLAAAGVDGIFTDDPRMMRAALER